MNVKECWEGKEMPKQKIGELPENLNVPVKIAGTDWEVKLQKYESHEYNGKRYTTFITAKGERQSVQDNIKATETLRTLYPNYAVFSNPRSRSIVFREK